MNQTNEVALPSINLCGTAREVLISDLCAAADALDVALERLERTLPHRRDYLLGPEIAYVRALDQYKDRVKAVVRVRDELRTIAGAL